ncbi:MAG TPA: DUF2723 domain-containing protein, partial [candidate division Zixibacteria bacterium]|nr:DUF2723 domain-containing protein [candidate division Zixibacteria bacterium]
MSDHTTQPAARHPEQGTDRTNRLVAGSVFAAVATVYALTVAPTFSFWDCGEFVACCYTLGIAHPPGSPLYLIIGRLFSVLPFLSDPGFGVNILSVLSSAGAALFGYLIVQRLIAGWGGAGRLASYTGGVVGALMLACGRTAWTNGVEAEVYGLTMLMLTAVFYLAVLVFDAVTVRRRMQYLVLAAYLMTLGAGVHMTVFLAAPVLLALFALRNSASAKVWYAFALFIAV